MAIAKNTEKVIEIKLYLTEQQKNNKQLTNSGNNEIIHFEYDVRFCIRKCLSLIYISEVVNNNKIKYVGKVISFFNNV